MGSGLSTENESPASTPKAQPRKMSIGSFTYIADEPSDEAEGGSTKFAKVFEAGKQSSEPKSPKSPFRRYSIGFQDVSTGVIMSGVLFGVVDGFGVDGPRIAQYVKHYYPKYFNERKKDAGESFEVQNALYGTLLQIDQDLLDKRTKDAYSIDASLSGASVTVCYYQKNKIDVAFLGDCVALLSCKDSNESSTGGVCAMQLTRNHFPENIREQRRIIKAGGIVSRWKMDNVGEIGKPCIWYGPDHPKSKDSEKQRPGCPLSRTIGYFDGRDVGCICEPETCHMKLLCGSYSLILATKGLWDVVDTKEATEIAGSIDLSNAFDASKKLAEIARERWEAEFAAEDITVQVLYTGNLYSAADTPKMPQTESLGEKPALLDLNLASRTDSVDYQKRRKT